MRTSQRPVRPPLDPAFHQAANEAAIERPPGGLRQSMRELSNSKKIKIIKRRKG